MEFSANFYGENLYFIAAVFVLFFLIMTSTLMHHERQLRKLCYEKYMSARVHVHTYIREHYVISKDK